MGFAGRLNQQAAERAFPEDFHSAYFFFKIQYLPKGDVKGLADRPGTRSGHGSYFLVIFDTVAPKRTYS